LQLKSPSTIGAILIAAVAISGCDIQPGERTETLLIVEGVVSSQGSNHPIKGATVQEYWVHRPASEAYADETDSLGVFHIPGRERGITELAIKAEGYRDTIVSSDAMELVMASKYVKMLQASVSLRPAIQ